MSLQTAKWGYLCIVWLSDLALSNDSSITFMSFEPHLNKFFNGTLPPGCACCKWLSLSWSVLDTQISGAKSGGVKCWSMQFVECIVEIPCIYQRIWFWGSVHILSQWVSKGEKFKLFGSPKFIFNPYSKRKLRGQNLRRVVGQKKV